jgi:hypothetical protein
MQRRWNLLAILRLERERGVPCVGTWEISPSQYRYEHWFDREPLEPGIEEVVDTEETGFMVMA